MGISAWVSLVFTHSREAGAGSIMKSRLEECQLLGLIPETRDFLEFQGYFWNFRNFWGVFLKGF